MSINNRNKKRILQIFRAPAGGIRRHVITILEGMDPNTFEFFVVTDHSLADEGYKDFISELPKNVSVCSLSIASLPNPKDFSNLFRLYFFFRKKKIDLIHGHGAKGGIYSRILGFFLSTKVLYTPHGGALHSMHGKMNLIYDWVEKILYYFTDFLVFESEYSKKQYCKKVKNKSDKYIVNLNAIPVSKQVPARSLNSTLRFCSFGALRKIKGHSVAIEACRLLANKEVDFIFDIYGQGEEEDNLKNQISDLGLQEKVQVMEGTIRPKDAMPSYDVLIQPSLFESFGYTLIEAMDFGIPSIASNVGGMKEIIRDNIDGLFFEVGNAYDLFEKMYTLSLDHELREKLGKEARKRLILDFDQKRMVSKLKELYCDT